MRGNFKIIVSRIWCFIPKPENNSLVNSTIIRHKRYNFDIGDIIDLSNVIANTYNLKLNILNEQRNGNYETTIVEPLAVSNNGVLFIHRRGDHYNRLVHRIYTKTVSSAFRLTSARSPSYPTGSAVAPILTSAHLPSSPIIVAKARSPTCTHPPSSSTRAATAHDPTVLSLHSVLQGSTRYIALHVLTLHPVLQGPPQHMTLQCSASIQFYKGTPGTWPYTCTSFTQLYKGRHSTWPYMCSPLHPAPQGHTRHMTLQCSASIQFYNLQGSTRYIALHVPAHHPALQGHTRHMTLHVYIVHPALQGPPQHMALQCSASIQFYKGLPGT